MKNLLGWFVAAIVFCIVMALGFVAAYLPPKRYEASATLLAQPAKASDFSSVSISLIQFLLPAVPEQVKSQTFKQKLDARLPVAMRGVHVLAAVEPGTGVIHITADDRNANATEVVANAAAETLTADRLSPILKISILDRARVPTAPASPRKVEILIAAAVLAILAGLGAALALAKIRRSPRTGLGPAAEARVAQETS